MSDHFVLIHGGWHGSSCWDGVVQALHELGATTTAVELPFEGFRSDADAARAAIQSAGSGATVVAHSYGGLVASAAASGLPVKRIVYIAAFMTEPGENSGALLADGLLPQSLTFDGDAVSVDPTLAASVFYGDATADTAATFVDQLRAMPISSGAEADTLLGLTPAWQATPTTYLVCTDDRALPPTSQRTMARRATTVIEWPTDHSPFVTHPRALAELLFAGAQG
jgi:pimeloyl-ACP methyl ester carboxylesterase